MFDDIVYFSTLVVSITLGSYYKNIDNIEVKRHYGTGVGMLVAFLICGHYLYHTILMVWLNVVIFKCCEKRYVHIASLAYTWMHLTYLHFYLYNVKYVVMMHQNIALRLVGIAFDLYSADRDRSKHLLKMNSDDFTLLGEISTADVLSYAFCFIGLHNGPYYRYKMFIDHLNGTFGSLGNFRQITESKLKKAFCCAVVYLILRMKYSTQMYYNNSFYEYDAESRYLYNVPIIMMFVLKNIILMQLCTSVCTEAGFGVYPAKTMPLPGHGPTTKFSSLNVTEVDDALKQEYNFCMVQCFNTDKLLMGPKMIDTVGGWHMPLHYWFRTNIHQNIISTSKEMRSACSFIAWTVWNGASCRSIIISSTLWVYINLEAEYSQLYNTIGQMKIAWDIGFSIMRTFCLIYLTPCFELNDASTILKYYHSIFWVFHVLLLVLIVGAIVTHKKQWPAGGEMGRRYRRYLDSISAGPRERPMPSSGTEKFVDDDRSSSELSAIGLKSVPDLHYI